eukprot:m.677019 g.677019  ORF g.677019 m.677019 type:complete len:123 (-) comp58568_c1_seq8:588-956(-)
MLERVLWCLMPHCLEIILERRLNLPLFPGFAGAVAHSAGSCVPVDLESSVPQQRPGPLHSFLPGLPALVSLPLLSSSSLPLAVQRSVSGILSAVIAQRIPTQSRTALPSVAQAVLTAAVESK